jgi:hypothetical protein
MTTFNYKKWVTEIKYGKQPHLFEEEDKESSKSDKSKSDNKGGVGTSDTPDIPDGEMIPDDILFPAGMKRESSSDLMEQINPNLRKISFRFVTTLCTSQYGNISLGDQDNCVLCHGHLNSNFGCPSFHVDGIPCCNGVGGGSSTYGATNCSMITVDGQVPQVGQLIQWDDTAIKDSIVEITGVHPPYTANNNPHNYPSVSCPTNVFDCSGTTTAGCDPSAWSNHANWTSTFTNTVNNLIANPNPNQPCTFLNNKIAQFTNQIPNVGPVWANQLQCKLDLANQLHTQNNC